MALSLLQHADQLLAHYAAYHLDKRNVALHALGVPLIVLAVAVGLTLVPTAPLNLAWLACLLVCAWYLTRGVALLGVVSTAMLVGLVLLAEVLAALPQGWLIGAGLFALGWAMQLLGHLLERRKPAFTNDLVSLPVGPMFVVAELLFALGWAPKLRAQVLADARMLRAAARER